MFTLIHNAYKYVIHRREKSLAVVVLGLNNAGKTTLKNTIEGIIESTSPTMGFSKPVEITQGKFQMKLMDLGGGKVIRRIWKEYLPEVHAIVYVIDAADSDRFDEAKAALETVLSEEYSAGKPILFLANKQDLPIAAAPAALSAQLGLTALTKNRSYNILGCTALMKEGESPDPRIGTALRWLCDAVGGSGYRALNRRVAADAAAWRETAAKEREAQRARAKAAREARARKREEEAAAAAAATSAEDSRGESSALMSSSVGGESTCARVAAEGVEDQQAGREHAHESGGSATRKSDMQGGNQGNGDMVASGGGAAIGSAIGSGIATDRAPLTTRQASGKDGFQPLEDIPSHAGTPERGTSARTGVSVASATPLPGALPSPTASRDVMPTSLFGMQAAAMQTPPHQSSLRPGSGNKAQVVPVT